MTYNHVPATQLPSIDKSLHQTRSSARHFTSYDLKKKKHFVIRYRERNLLFSKICIYLEYCVP